MEPPPIEELPSQWKSLHNLACEHKEDFYIDPDTGYRVFTAYKLSQRSCCGSGCRHCPHNNLSKKSQKGNAPTTSVKVCK